MRRFLGDVVLYGVMAGYVMLAPYTKVEESFNVQATHDILRHGADLASYDHQQFPGAVPRSFLGALAVALGASPASLAGATGVVRLYSVRLALGFFSVAAHARLRSAVSAAWGPLESRCFAAIAALQFHLPFYMSRPLPNTFALIFACLAQAELISGSGYAALGLLGFAAAIFRCDLLLLIAPAGLLLLAQQRVGFLRAAVATALAAAAGAAASVAVDSAFWGRRLWPELEVLWFNTAENRSSEWGTSPPLWYFYSALPRALLGAAPLAAAGVALERRVRGPVLVALCYVSLYSLLPHKELRFVFPALPLLNAAASAGAARLLRRKGLAGWLSLLAVLGLAGGSLLASVVMAAASASNYPGGTAMAALHRAEPRSPALSVHIGNLAATTGVSRFLEAHDGWSYSKEEGLQAADLYAKGFDRLLTEWSAVPGYACLGVVYGFDRLALWRPFAHGAFGRLLARLPLPWIERAPRVYVLARLPAGGVEPPALVACGEGDVRWG